MNKIQEIKNNGFRCPKCSKRFMKPFVYRENCITCGFVPVNQKLPTLKETEREFISFHTLKD